MDNLKTCFVICPIGKDDSPTRIWADMVFDCIITPAVEKFGIESQRADKISTPGLITPQLIESIINSDLVIADLTDLNPNVLYELAIRHTVNKAVIQMIKKDQTIPFDNQDIRTIFFDIDVRSAHLARIDLRKQIESIIKGEPFYNPVTFASTLSDMKTNASGDKKFAAEVIEKITSQMSAHDRQIRDLTKIIDSMQNRVFVSPAIGFASISSSDSSGNQSHFAAATPSHYAFRVDSNPIERQSAINSIYPPVTGSTSVLDRLVRREGEVTRIVSTSLPIPDRIAIPSLTKNDSSKKSKKDDKNIKK